MFTSKCSKTMFKKKEEKTLHEVILILSNSLKLQKEYKPNYRLKTKLAISINATNKFFQLRHNSTEHLSHHLLVYLQFKNWILYIQNFIGISYPTKIERKIKLTSTVLEEKNSMGLLLFLFKSELLIHSNPQWKLLIFYITFM